MPEYLLTVREDEDGLFIRLPPESRSNSMRAHTPG